MNIPKLTKNQAENLRTAYLLELANGEGRGFRGRSYAVLEEKGLAKSALCGVKTVRRYELTPLGREMGKALYEAREAEVEARRQRAARMEKAWQEIRGT